MRYPNLVNYTKWIRFFILVFLGMIIGSLTFMVSFGEEIDRLHLQINQLKYENETYQTELKELTEAQKKAKQRQKMTIEDVDVVFLEPKPNPITETELIKWVKRETKFLEGKSVESVNDLHLAVQQLFKNRTVKIGNQTIRIELKMLTIYKTMHLYLTAKPEQITP
jgi:hypothetical protein